MGADLPLFAASVATVAIHLLRSVPASVNTAIPLLVVVSCVQEKEEHFGILAP
jgi:hypothetical protein